MMYQKTEAHLFAEDDVTAADGTFTLWSTDQRSPVRVYARRGGNDDAELRGTVNGATGLELVVDRIGSVAGRVLLDDHVSPYGFSIGLHSEDYGNNGEQLDELARFHFGATRNGKYRVSIRALNGYVKFYSAEVELRGGELVDAALIEEIDLRGKVFPVPIQVSLLGQTECDGFTIRPRGAILNPRCEAWGDSWTLLLDSLPADLLISKPGYRTVEVHATGEEVFVEFVPGPAVTLTVDHPEWIPNGWHLKAYFSNPRELAYLGEEIPRSGECSLALSDPGEYTLGVRLIGASGWNRGTVFESTFELAEDGSTAISITLDEQVIRKAVEQ